ncbi:hypothetical protein MUB04_16070 [Acinetobacter indicus]|uniref:hypothetical protein n=1 Tax=Acinetobacter TaxID=469 RepID=UPI0015D35DCC|nr:MULTISPECIES: hypothetical protein [Acinetobacter]MCP0918056.1 hypothetical protein [Acinetobacter indicus]
MTLTADSIDRAIAKLPRHYKSVVTYLFGDGELRINLLQACLKRLELMNVSAAASMCVYRSGDYDTDTKFQEYIFDVLKKGAFDKTILDSPRSLLKTEIVRAFKIPDFLNRCIDFGLTTPDKVADVLLGSAKSAPLEQTVLRNMFVQTHVSILLLMLAVELGLPLSKENKLLYRAVKRPYTGHEFKILISDLWNRYKYIGLIVFSFALMAQGGPQGLSLLSEPAIYLPYMDINQSILSPKNLLLFKLYMMVIFGFMLYLIIGHKFHYLVQPDRKTNSDTQDRVKKIVPAFYITLLIYMTSPVIGFIDSLNQPIHPVEAAVEKRDFKEAESLVIKNTYWSNEQKNFVLAQLLIKQRYEVPKDEYNTKLAQYSQNILKEYSFGRFSTEYAESYGVKKILDANNIENTLVPYDSHRAVLFIWLMVLVYCFVSLSIEVDHFGIKRHRDKKLKAKQAAMDSNDQIKI